MEYLKNLVNQANNQNNDVVKAPEVKVYDGTGEPSEKILDIDYMQEAENEDIEEAEAYADGEINDEEDFESSKGEAKVKRAPPAAAQENQSRRYDDVVRTSALAPKEEFRTLKESIKAEQKARIVAEKALEKSRAEIEKLRADIERTAEKVRLEGERKLERALAESQRNITSVHTESGRAIAEAEKTAQLEIAKIKAAYQAEIEKEKKAADQEIERLRAEREHIITRARLDVECATDNAKLNTKAEVDKANKAAQAEIVKIKADLDRERVKVAKVYETEIGKVKKELERAIEKQQRAEKTAAEKSSAASERSRELASLRMELNHEKMKAARAMPPALTSNFGMANNYEAQNSNMDLITTLQHMFNDFAMKMRAGSAPPPLQQPYLTAPSSSSVDTNTLSNYLQQQQNAVVSQITAVQAQHQAQIDELMRQQKEAIEELTRKQQESEETITRKQQEIEEELTRQLQEYNPSIDEVADLLDDALKSRGTAPSSALYLSDLLKQQTKPQQYEATRKEPLVRPAVIAETVQPAPTPTTAEANTAAPAVEADPLDELILNLSRELDGLRSQLDDGKKKKKKK